MRGQDCEAEPGKCEMRKVKANASRKERRSQLNMKFKKYI
jgi:hypothetical protein